MRLIFAVLALLVPFCASYNILAIFHFNGKSHFVMFERLMLALAEKGHKVDIVAHFAPKKSHPNYNLINIGNTLPNIVGNISVTDFRYLSSAEMIQFITHTAGIDICKNAFSLPEIQKIKTNPEKKYDVFIGELFGTDCMLGFGHHFNIPTILMSSSVPLPWTADRIGLPDNPAYIPNYFTYFTDKMSLYQRVVNTASLIYYKYLYHHYGSSENNRLAKEFFGEDLPTLEDLAKNTSLIMVNGHLSINYPRPVVPNFVEVGGLHIYPPEKLNKHFEDLTKLEKNQKGLILLSMGSLIMTESFPISALEGMFKAFSEVPYKVIWKADKAKFPKNLTVPQNIHFEKWLPQMDLLCHENVKLFVSHGGLMGTQEAIYCGVPRLGIPIFADQENNIQASELLGIGVKLQYELISYETVSKALRKLLGDESYWENAQRVSKVFRDRPMSALDTAIFWVEYVIRHKGARHLRVAGADMPFWQYYLLDVGLVFAVCLALPILLVFYLFRIVFQSKNEKAKSD